MEIAIICVPYQNDVARWGMARGPQAFLDAGLVDALRATGHHTLEPVWIELPRSERTRDTVTNLGNLARRTAAEVELALRRPDETFVVVLEGNCTHALGPLGGLAQVKGTPGIAWFDAHADMHTMQTTTTGLLGGMPYAVALGWEFPDWREAAGLDHPVRPQAAALIGTSDLDPEEVAALTHHPILHIDASALMEAGARERVAQAIRPRAREAATWYLHIDLDVAGPQVVPGAMTPAPYWPPRHHLVEAVAAVTRSVPVAVVSLAAYNPEQDQQRLGAAFGIDMLMAVIANKE
ncbi:MAG TPA: arginase family protein [Ktedonobacteraceae bacterium]|nr:arginase family protein [Ktedonobacteraceae bacterium]